MRATFVRRRSKPLACDAPLSGVLTPGIRLSTFHEAGGYLSERFANVLQDAVLERAIELLLAAVESGALADRKGATDQVARVLHCTRLL